MKKSIIAAMVIAAAVSMASCTDTGSIPVSSIQQPAAAAETAASAADTTDSEEADSPQQEENAVTTVTEKLPESSSSAAVTSPSADNSLNDLKTVTVLPSEPAKTAAERTPVTESAEDGTEDTDVLNGYADTAVHLMNYTDMYLKGQKTDSSVMYDSNFEQTDITDEACYLPVAVEERTFRFSSIDDLDYFLNVNFTERQMSEMGYYDLLGNFTEHNSELYYSYYGGRDMYFIFERIDDSVEVIDDSSFSFKVHLTTNTGKNYFIIKVFMTKTDTGYAVDHIEM